MNPAADRLDRSCFLCRAGKPHNPAIAHLTETHSLPATAGYLFTELLAGRQDPDTRRILAALREHRETDPAQQTYGCLKWYLESPRVYDTNASFFVCTPLTGIWLARRDRLDGDELAELQGVFADVLPWFSRMAHNPSLFYPNKCISDAAMLLAAGHVLGDETVTNQGRDFARRYFYYYRRRGTGWGEDHSPCYTKVILEMTLLIMALEGGGDVHDAARGMTDAIMDWADFHDGLDAVPSIRGYNFGANLEVKYGIAPLFGTTQEEPLASLLGVLKKVTGYHWDRRPLPVPRQRRWRTFDQHYSTSYIGPQARLGSLSAYPLMPNSYMHDGWGLGWQSKPCAFLVPGREYGILQWLSEDDEGVVRRHESGQGMHEWASRHLFKRLSFHPDVEFVGHQEGGAAIVLREIHRLHSPTWRLVDRWRLAKGAGRLLVDGAEPVNGEVPPGAWLVLDYGTGAVALRALSCRIPAEPEDDGNPQRRTQGHIAEQPLRISREGDEIHLDLVLAEGCEYVLTEPLLFTGWCIVLLDRAGDAAALRVEESFREDGEIPRTYGELIRTVTLATSEHTLTLERDMLARTARRWLDGQPV
ncbi:MAG: hypothetical protein RBU25_10630 [Lentisphaeria bacterium]|jgi:hypothetical protein|nr:hypothetical protein [Lentisphaeria bacterium]